MDGNSNQQRAFQQWRHAARKAHSEHVPFHEPWRNAFANFLKDMGDPPLGKILVRRDSLGGFTPGNVFWG